MHGRTIVVFRYFYEKTFRLKKVKFALRSDTAVLMTSRKLVYALDIP